MKPRKVVKILKISKPTEILHARVNYSHVHTNVIVLILDNGYNNYDFVEQNFHVFV